MNAAAKVIQQSHFFAGHWSALSWDNRARWTMILLMAVLCSALAVIYVTNENRLSHIELQQLEQQAQAMHLHAGQLLLEQASLATAERIEALAQQKLQMHMPFERHSFVLQVA